MRVELNDYVAFGFGVNASDGSADDGTGAVYDVRKCGESASAVPILSGTATRLTDAGYVSGCYEVYFQAVSPAFVANATYLVFVTVTVDGTITPTKCLGAFTIAPSPSNITQLVGSATAATILKNMLASLVTGAVSADISPTSTVFDTDILTNEDQFTTQNLLWTSGANAGMTFKILTYEYTGGSVKLTLASPMPNVPSTSDAFQIIGVH